MRGHLRRASALGSCVLAGLLLAPGPAPAAGDPELRATMHELFAQIRVLLPLALDDEAFARP